MFARFLSKIKATDGCWDWTGGKNRFGYGSFQLRTNKSILAHRTCWNMFNGEIPIGVCVYHKCDNPGCVNPDHLFLGTHKENMEDKIKKGRHNCAKGEKNGMSKLKNDDVVKIKEMIGLGLKNHEIVKKFGYSHLSVSRIRHNKIWKHLQ